MNQKSLQLEKNPELSLAEDYYRLRRAGIGYLAQLSSDLWTDYNTHDPGITILEALCYAITDLAYRIGWNIEDILAPSTKSTTPDQPFPHQAFFTARQILTVNPTTPDDLRRLLIDLEMIRNAWVMHQECACDFRYYAWCEKDRLRLASQPPTDDALAPVKIAPQGLYDILLELESDPVLGDLNDRKLENRSWIFDDDGKPHQLLLEMRFPEWGPAADKQWKLFLDREDIFGDTKGASFDLQIKFGAAKNYDLLTDSSLDDAKRDAYLRNHWRNVLYVDFEIKVPSLNETIIIENATLRIFGDAITKSKTTVQNFKDRFADKSSGGFIQQYRRKLLKIEQALKEARTQLNRYRNLDEDFCRVRVVEIEDVAVCADVEVRPDADIDKVQAQIWFEIERYFNPPVPFYSLPELMNENFPVEEIFNGPELSNGFIKAEDLQNSVLKTELRTSDIYNRLMDIEGVIAVNDLMLTGYDDEGNVINGAGDSRWLQMVSPLHQPRLYQNFSRFLFFKNGLPFSPRMDEVQDTLIQLHGEAERPKIKNAPTDLSIPEGIYRHPDEYYPVQHSLPVTYGVGPEGLPSQASTLRRAQAQQLKAYLLVFEQLLANAFAQIANSAKLFSLDPGTDQTYFFKEFDEKILPGYPDLKNGLTSAILKSLVENRPEFLERRNRFLNHLLARFGEDFNEYALLLTNLEGQQIALEELIADKIAFLQEYPEISHDRGKAFNLSITPNAPENISGLKKRLGLLLGQPELKNDRMIIVEHLLLRPKFPGDALFPVCTEASCTTCGDEDPYSFRLTFVMPGWTAPYNTNMEMRRFAERTIRQEMPSHLLGKICWVGNDGFTANPCDQVVNDLVTLLTASHQRPDEKDACACAGAIYQAFSDVFDKWYADKALKFFSGDAIDPLLSAEFQARIEPAKIACTTISDNNLWKEIQDLMVKYFHRIVLSGWQFERFEKAWQQWLESNAKIDWTQQHPQSWIAAILRRNLSPDNPATVDSKILCDCAATILMKFGQNFYEWMETNSNAGLELDDFPEFHPDPVELCNELKFKPGTESIIESLLNDQYKDYREVSYRLRMVVNLLSKLRNIYPGATLHDCDDGSDQNPVRLGNTALGNYPLRTPNSDNN